MSKKSIAVPGPIAERTYDSAFRTAATAGVIGVVLLFSIGPLSITSGSHVLFTVLFYPMYLLTVSVGLGVWLGYTTDERNLEPVYERADVETEEQ